MTLKHPRDFLPAFLLAFLVFVPGIASALNISLAQSGRSRYDFKRHAIQ